MTYKNKNLYPTPETFIYKMLEGINLKEIYSILEPSAGLGDIIAVIIKKVQSLTYSLYKHDIDIDCIEIDSNLRAILKGKNFRVIHDDFLTFETYKKYDLIIMNPPFDNGDRHLLKAINILESTGGKIRCLLNSETIKNPYTNSRKVLINYLNKFNAYENIKFIKDVFIESERQTAVEIALISIDIPKKSEDESIILDTLRQEESNTVNNNYSSDILHFDKVKALVDRYNFEVNVGRKIFNEYEVLKKYMSKSFSDKAEPALNFNTDFNGYLKIIRRKYWELLFTSKEFISLFTSNLQSKYLSEVENLKHYDFSIFNVNEIKKQMNSEIITSVEQTILDLFDDFSHKHSWHPETQNNIHYYNGWYTNKAHKINKKVILPLNGFDWYHTSQLSPDYKVKEKLTDIEKVFNYLDNGMTSEINLIETLTQATESQTTKNIDTKYFYITFYKKGTCHLVFKNLGLLKKFNIFGSQKKGWLPPSYGKKRYSDMGDREKEVINSFEGKKEYDTTFVNNSYYLANNILLLA